MHPGPPGPAASVDVGAYLVRLPGSLLAVTSAPTLTFTSAIPLLSVVARACRCW